MHNSADSYEQAQDVDLRLVFLEIWHAKWKILALTLTAGFLTYALLSLVKPQYSSEAKIIIDKEDPGFTRPTFQNNTSPQNSLDKAAIVTQAEMLQSNDLAMVVARQLNLKRHKEFMNPGKPGLFKGLLIKMGLSQDWSKLSQEELIRQRFATQRNVYQISDSRVITVQFTSTDPDLAPKTANLLAEKYVSWQKKARLEQTVGATSWLKEQIDQLRIKVARAESEVARFQSENGLLSGSNNVRLDKQQLSELNSQLILASTKRSETEARAKLIRRMLNQTGDIKEFSDVLRSGLIQRLLEQRVVLQRRVSELSATYLPSHPTVRRMNSELSELQSQIRKETKKIMVSVENEAAIAQAREKSLKSNLGKLTQNAGLVGSKKAQLQELEREAETNRKILEAYLSRYREASDRDDRSLPSLASIISHAYKSSLPTFPRKGPFMILAMFGAFLLGLLLFGTRAVLRYVPSTSQMNQMQQQHQYGEQQPGYATPAIVPAQGPDIAASPHHAPAYQQADANAHQTHVNAQQAHMHTPGEYAPPPASFAEKGAGAPAITTGHSNVIHTNTANFSKPGSSNKINTSFEPEPPIKIQNNLDIPGQTTK